MSIESHLATYGSRYNQLMGAEASRRIMQLFREIDAGKYSKAETHTFSLRDLPHPVTMRAIRADMQSFVNTFIEPYFDKKPYLSDARFVVDAGGNTGFTAALFASWWPDAKIVSIEPDFENFQLAQKNTSPYRNVEVLHGALWNKEADLKIEAGQEDGFVVREITGDTALNPLNLTRGFSLDQILRDRKINKIDFLKLNIEGSEKEVFSANYESWLPHTTAMLIELHDGKNAGCSTTVFGAVAPYGFAVAETAPYGVLFVKEKIYRNWYAKWYRESIYEPNISKERFPDFYLDREHAGADQ